MKQLKDMNLSLGMSVICIEDGNGFLRGDLTPGRKYKVVQHVGHCKTVGIINDAGRNVCSDHGAGTFIDCPADCGDIAFVGAADDKTIIGDTGGNLFINGTITLPAAIEEVMVDIKVGESKSGEKTEIVNRHMLADETELRITNKGNVYHGSELVYQPKLLPHVSIPMARCLSQLPIDTLVDVEIQGDSYRAFTTGGAGEVFANGTNYETNDEPEENVVKLMADNTFRVVNSNGIQDYEGQSGCPVPPWVKCNVLVDLKDSEVEGVGLKTLMYWTEADVNTNWSEVNAYEITGEVE
jgi:hypothetical protein